MVVDVLTYSYLHVSPSVSERGLPVTLAPTSSLNIIRSIICIVLYSRPGAVDFIAVDEVVPLLP